MNAQLSLFGDAVMMSTCVAFSDDPKEYGPFLGGFVVGDRVTVIGIGSFPAYIGMAGTVVEFNGTLAGWRGMTVPVILDGIPAWRPFWPQDLGKVGT